MSSEVSLPHFSQLDAVTPTGPRSQRLTYSLSRCSSMPCRTSGFDTALALAASAALGIVMTALATIFALVPLALGLSESAGIVGQPLAITVIGGLTSSTVLTLAVVPALYLVLQGRRQERIRERRTNPAS